MVPNAKEVCFVGYGTLCRPCKYIKSTNVFVNLNRMRIKEKTAGLETGWCVKDKYFRWVSNLIKSLAAPAKLEVALLTP